MREVYNKKSEVMKHFKTRNKDKLVLSLKDFHQEYRKDRLRIKNQLNHYDEHFTAISEEFKDDFTEVLESEFYNKSISSYGVLKKQLNQLDSWSKEVQTGIDNFNKSSTTYNLAVQGNRDINKN